MFLLIMVISPKKINMTKIEVHHFHVVLDYILSQDKSHWLDEIECEILIELLTSYNLVINRNNPFGVDFTQEEETRFWNIYNMMTSDE